MLFILMVYNYVSGREIVAILYNDYAVNSAAWEQNAPRWITDGLLRLGTLKGLEKKTTDISITNYMGRLPHHCRRIDSIVYNGEPVTIVAINGSIKSNDHSTTHHAQIDVHNIEFDEKEATLTINYRGLPVELDEETNTYFPLIPDSPEVKQYLTFYLLQALIIQGYKHHIFAVDSRNPDTNIFTVLAKSEKIARSKINKMSKFEREEIANDMSSFFTDYNYNKNKDFNYMRNT